MARRSNVPKFGEWENESNVPYTVYFDKARKTRGDEKLGLFNPNDPAQFQPRGPEKKGQMGPDPARPNQNRARPNNGPKPEPEQRFPRGGGARRQNEPSFEASPLHRNQNGRASSHHQGGSGSNPRRVAQPKQRDDFSPAVPEFGNWEKNQESGEGYTEKFNKVLQDRQRGAVTPSPIGYNHRHDANKSPKKKKFLCFPWI